ncbi:MAG: T9SS type A sorting domain-containing protein, partial [Bacteroidales bacterium]|nr:T9SS type A sorting domain-containing protein [Bacteroidales bacterium]
RQIVVSGADGMPVSIYDIQGRPLATMHAAFGQTIRFDVPATGVYMVRVGNIKAQRVAVLR